MSRYVALRYLTGFNCLGRDCSDNCCHDWTVAVDRARYATLARLVGADNVPLAPPNARTKASFASLRLLDDGRCALLDGDGWCTLHATHGEAALPDACAIYPRVHSLAGERHELSAELSCPEVARRCLTAPDATELVPCEPSLAGRARVLQRSCDSDAPYLRFNDAIRGALYRLLSRTRYRVAERLFFLACFAQSTAELFTHETARFDGKRLGGELRLLDDELALDGLRDHFATLAGAPEVVVDVLVRMLATWLEQHCAPRFRELVRAVLESLAGGAGESLAVDAADVCRAFLARKAEREPLVAERLELILGNYCRHFVIRHWYTDSPDLVVYAQHLLVRVATARLIILCHPRLSSLASLPPDARAPLVDSVAVETFYTLTRALEHNVALVRGVTATLRERLPSLAHAVALLKL